MKNCGVIVGVVILLIVGIPSIVAIVEWLAQMGGW